jgi:hypothetical protein
VGELRKVSERSCAAETPPSAALSSHLSAPWISGRESEKEKGRGREREREREKE